MTVVAPVIDTERLRLRQYEMDDLDDLADIRRRPDVMRYLYQDVQSREEVAEVLWERRLQVSLGTMFDGTYYRQMHLEDYVDLHIVPWGTPAQVGPFQLTTRRTIHHIPTAGLRIGAAGKTLGYSCDTAWDPEHMAWLESADTILHETSLGPAHTALFHLMELPESLRRKMYVVHYPDSLAEPDELRFAREGDVLTVGSAGRFV